MEYALHNKYLVPRTKQPFPAWLFYNKIESTQIQFFKKLVPQTFSDDLKNRIMIGLVRDRENFKSLLNSKKIGSFQMTGQSQDTDMMNVDSEYVPEIMQNEETLPYVMYPFTYVDEDSVKFFTNGTRVKHEPRPNNLVSTFYDTDSSEHTEVHTNISYHNTLQPINSIPQATCTSKKGSMFSTYDVPKKIYAYVSIAGKPTTTTTPTNNVPTNINIHDQAHTEPEDLPTYDSKIQHKLPTENPSTDNISVDLDLTTYYVPPNTKNPIITPDQDYKYKAHINNSDKSAESSIIYSNFLDHDSLTTTAANFEIKKIAKEMEEKLQEQIKSFEDK